MSEKPFARVTLEVDVYYIEEQGEKYLQIQSARSIKTEIVPDADPENIGHIYYQTELDYGFELEPAVLAALHEKGREIIGGPPL